MKKFSCIYICASVIAPPKFIFADDLDKEKQSRVPSLQFLSTKKAFDFKNDLTLRQRLKEQLERHDLKITDALDFEGLVIGDIDLSGFDLWRLKFSGGTFNHTNLSNTNLDEARFQRVVLNNVNLKGTDLREAFSDPNYFKGCVFNNVNLKGALLYGETKEEYLYLKGTSDPFNLVRQYSDLMKKARIKRDENFIKEAKIFEKQAQAINNLFTAIPLDLEGRDLRNFDLTGLDLRNANLKNTKLQGTRLSKNVVVPDNSTNINWTPLFEKWMNGNNEEEKIFQDLLNAGVDLFKRIDNTRLQQVDWGNKNLKNADFKEANLQNCDFTGVNLREINLKDAEDICELRLSKNVIVPHYSLYNWTPLFDKWINGNEEEREIFEDLLNAGVGFFRGVDNTRLQQVDWRNKNLKNADFFYSNLSNCNFIGVDLREINLTKVDNIFGLKLSENVTIPYHEFEDYTLLFDKWINGSEEEQKLFQNLLDARFNFFRRIDHTRLQQVDWTNRNLKNAIFSNGIIYANVDLREFNFSGANLSYADLLRCKLEGANFKGANLTGANLKETFLSDKIKLQSNDIPKELQEIYRSESDPKVKKLAKQLLKGLGYLYPIEEN